MTKKVLIPIADGFEETEAISVVDILKRAQAEVVIAGVENRPIKGRSDITVVPDCGLDDIDSPFDLVVLPGGLPSAFTLRDDPRVIDILQRTHRDKGIVAAICAAPVALDRAGLLRGETFTSFPGMKSRLPASGYSEDRVVVSANVITSRSPGTAIEFAFELVRALFGNETVETVNEGVLAKL